MVTEVQRIGIDLTHEMFLIYWVRGKLRILAPWLYFLSEKELYRGVVMYLLEDILYERVWFTLKVNGLEPIQTL